MQFKVTAVEHHCWPDAEGVERALDMFGLTIEDMRGALASFEEVFDDRLGGGFQQHLARALERYLENLITMYPELKRTSTRYNGIVNLMWADVNRGSRCQ
jgi:hypothetical protein